MRTFALAPRPPPRDASSECSSSSSDATRPRPARAGRGPRAGRTHRLASRARVPTGPDGNEENAPPVFVCAFSEPKPSAPRPPADAERSALLRAVRDAEEEASGSCNGDSARRRKARDGNGKARRFGAAFDGNRPRTPPPPTETEGARRRKNAFLRRRTATRFSPRGAAGADANRGRPVRGGGGTDVDVENGEANVCDAVPGMEAVPARGSQTLWAPGGSAYVRAWGASTEEPSSFAARSSVSRESSSASSSRSGSRACSARDPFKVVPIPTQKLGQRTALAIDALRSTRRRAWSADASPYAASLAGTGTLPPARGAKKAFSFDVKRDDVKRDVKRADERRSFGTRLESLETRFGSNERTNRTSPSRETLSRKQKSVFENWERRCAALEAERDAARAEVAARDAAVAALTRRLAEAEARDPDPDPDPDPAERGTVTETTRVTNERFVFDTSVDASEASPSSPFARSPSSTSPMSPKIPGLARRFFSSSPSSRTSIGRSPRSPVSPVSPVSPESHEHGGGGITAVVEDSPPSAFLGFFPASPPRLSSGSPSSC